MAELWRLLDGPRRRVEAGTSGSQTSPQRPRIVTPPQNPASSENQNEIVPQIVAVPPPWDGRNTNRPGFRLCGVSRSLASIGHWVPVGDEFPALTDRSVWSTDPICKASIDPFRRFSSAAEGAVSQIQRFQRFFGLARQRRPSAEYLAPGFHPTQRTLGAVAKRPGKPPSYILIVQVWLASAFIGFASGRRGPSWVIGGANPCTGLFFGKLPQ
jgi:hypothetical protein